MKTNSAIAINQLYFIDNGTYVENVYQLNNIRPNTRILIKFDRKIINSIFPEDIVAVKADQQGQTFLLKTVQSKAIEFHIISNVRNSINEIIELPQFEVA